MEGKSPFRRSNFCGNLPLLKDSGPQIVSYDRNWLSLPFLIGVGLGGFWGSRVLLGVGGQEELLFGMGGVSESFGGNSSALCLLNGAGCKCINGC